MAVTKRDMLALQFLRKFKVARLEQIDKVAYNYYQVCARNMRKLHKDGLVHKRNDKYRQGIYYTIDGRTGVKQYYHYMLRNDLYIKLLELSDSIDEVIVEPTYGSIQSDMMVIGKYKGKSYFILCECESVMNVSPVNTNKYNSFFINEWRQHLFEKPTVLFVTDKKIDADKITYKHLVIGTDLEKLEEALQGAEKF